MTITEKQLRRRVVDTILAWVGAKKGSALHADILAVYNGYKPIARGYTMKTNDAYCAATVSAAYIRAGIAAYTGTECGVEEFTLVEKPRGFRSRTTHMSRQSATLASMIGTTTVPEIVKARRIISAL